MMKLAELNPVLNRIMEYDKTLRISENKIFEINEEVLVLNLILVSKEIR